MGVRTRGLDIGINAKRQAADAAMRAEAKGVIDRWNEQLAAGRDMLWSPTIRAAPIAGSEIGRASAAGGERHETSLEHRLTLW
jgi:hypothetical protein